MTDPPASELSASEEHYWLFENQHTIMLIYDPRTFRIVDANPTACQFYGYTRAQLAALKITDLNGLSLEQAAQAWHDWQRAPHQPYVLKHRLASGEVRDVEAYAGPIEFRGQTYQYSIVHDITGRKQIEDALQRERNFVSTVLDTVGALVVVVGTAMLVSADLATPVTTPRAEVQENNWPEFGSALRAAATMTEAAVGVTAACVTVTVKAPVRDGATKRYS